VKAKRRLVPAFHAEIAWIPYDIQSQTGDKMDRGIPIVYERIVGIP